jgi:hypothetical protein
MKKNKFKKRRSKSEIEEIIRKNIECKKRDRVIFNAMSHSKRKRFARGCRKDRMLSKEVNNFLYKKYGDPQELKRFLEQRYRQSSAIVKDMIYHVEKDHETQQFFAKGSIVLPEFARKCRVKELFKSWEIQLFDSDESYENNISF